MRKALPILFLTILALFLMTSCDRTLAPDSTFIGSSDIELTVGGSVIYKYDPAT